MRTKRQKLMVEGFAKAFGPSTPEVKRDYQVSRPVKEKQAEAQSKFDEYMKKNNPEPKLETEEDPEIEKAKKLGYRRK